MSKQFIEEDTGAHRVQFRESLLARELGRMKISAGTWPYERTGRESGDRGGAVEERKRVAKGDHSQDVPIHSKP